MKRYEQGYVAHAVGFQSAVVGEGDTYDAALADVTSAIRCAIETFGEEAFEPDFPLLDVSLAAVRASADANG